MDRDRRDEVFEQTVATVWREERVSCPHRDILRAYLEGSLEEAPAGYLRFHLETARCPWCTMALQELRREMGVAPPPEPRVDEALEKALRSTITHLRNSR